MKRRVALFAAVAAGVMAVGGIAISQQLAVELDTDRFGGDYREIPLRAGETYEVCAKACVEDAPCQAWTWVPQGTQRDEGPNCWLKDSTPEGGRVRGVVSGLRGAGLPAAPVSTPASAAAGSSAQNAQIVLFSGDDFGGRYVSLTAATASLHTDQLDFGDATWSLAANGRWEVCEDVDFGGQCRIFEGDHAGLRDFGGTISSARYVGPGAASAVLSQTDPRRGVRSDPNRPRSQVPGVIERTGQAAADEAERRVQDRIREGIGRIF